jgi:alpha/beta superfamily hydrolase
MSESGGITHRTFEFDSLDGPRLVGDLAMPAIVHGATVVCHPHPHYGGTRFDTVVSALYTALPAAGIATLRFDFRSQFSDGVGERLDALAALDELAAAVPAVAIAIVGYSFGAWVALGLDDARVGALVAVAPPLSAMAEPLAPPSVPTLVLTPAHDQFSPPTVVAPTIDDWRSRSGAPIDFEVIEMADHFLAGRTAAVAERVASWLSGRWRLPSPL